MLCSCIRHFIQRILLYLAHIWNAHIETTNQNRYGSKKLELPRPELYMIYTGRRKSRPAWLNLSDEFFEGNRDFLEAKVRVLYGEGKKDIISQYVDFTTVYNEQVKRYGETIGEARGEMKKARETALNMKQEGMPVNMIARVLNVGQELVQQWFSEGV